MEVWLHQHIFKVGWLVTNQYQTTTILYYAFFLPGILLNQVTIWTVAGFLNVRAKRSLAWPQKQEIGELNLNFVQLSKNVDPFRLALISTAPLFIGFALTWHIANNILHIQTFIAMMGKSGFLGNVAGAVSELTTAPDFWLWVYIAFTISNTMMPKFSNLRGWRIIIGALVVLVIALYALGVGNQVVMDNLLGPVTDSLNSLSSIFAIIIGLDIFMVAVLGTLEAIIERVTGDSATFENGKMITMSRAEMLEKRAKALAVQPKTAKAAAVPSGPPSVYKLQLTMPGAPGKESVTRDEGIIITPDPNLRLPSPAATPLRSNPAVISGSTADKLPSSTESAPSSTPLRSYPAINSGADTEKPAPSTPARPAAAPLSGSPARPSLPSGSSSPQSGTPARPAPSPYSANPTAPRPPQGSPSGSPSAPQSGAPSRPMPTPYSGSSSTSQSGNPARPMPSQSSGNPSAPLSGTPARPASPGSASGSPSGAPARPTTGSPFNNPAAPRPPQGSSSGSPTAPQSGAPVRPGSGSSFENPATPKGTARPPVPASPRPPGTSPFQSPTAKPPIDDIDDEDDDDSDIIYEDFDDPA